MLLRDRIYGLIRRAILDCAFAPGEELREQELAARYGVSRSPIRDSLHRLEREGLVTVLPRQGYLVNSVSLDDVRDLFRLRLVIEPACAAAAARADDGALGTLGGLRDFPIDDYDEATLVQYDRSFHRAVAELSGNQRLVEVATEMFAQFERVARAAALDGDCETARQACAEHDAIIDAVMDHDSDRASRCARAHTDGAQSRILAQLTARSGLAVA